MTESEQSPPPFQFSIRTLLTVTTVCAVVAWAWPFRDSRDPLMHLFLAAPFLSFTVTLGLFPAALRQLRGRQSDVSTGLREERTGLGIAVIASLPCAFVWVVAVLTSHQSGYWRNNPAASFLGDCVVILHLPTMIILLLSFMIYWHPRRSSPLFVMRVVTLIASLAWPYLLWLIFRKYSG